MATAPRAAKPAKKTAAADRLRAEVEPGDRIGLLAGREIVVKPSRKWKSSANDAISRTGNWEVWAATSLKGDGFEIWREVDPDREQIEAFVDSWRDATGEDLGESAAS